MQNKKSDVAPKKNVAQIVLTVLLSIVMLVSYVVALVKIESPVDYDRPSLESSEPILSTEPSQTSEPENHVLPTDYDYYDKLSFKTEECRNAEVVNGTLALIKEGKGYPDVIGSDLITDEVIGIYRNMSSNAYGLSGSSLEVYDDAFRAFDSLAVWFKGVIGVNCLLVNRAYTDPKSAQLSGKSLELSSGYSFELSAYGGDYQITDADFVPLREQCYAYGLIQRYPEGKSEYTGYQVDCQYYRYVGVAHSDYIQRYKLSLEEYIDKIKTEKVIEFKSRIETNTAYVVYYVPCETNSNITRIPVPSSGEEYTISGDGSGGFVVTAKIQL